MEKRKKLLLITSSEVIDNGKVSYWYVFQDPSLKAFAKFPDQCCGPFGIIRESDKDGIYYISAFQGKEGLLFTAPIYVNDKESIERTVNEVFPEAFSLICSKKIADMLVPLISSFINVSVLLSKQTLLTAN